MTPRTIESDFLVIGSGIAGLTFAIRASQLGTVTIVTKKKDFDSSTQYAQGGIASVLSPEDSFERHIEDTLKAGAGLCDREAVEVLVRNGPECIKELIQWGAEFSFKSDEEGEHVLDLGREGAHSRNRIVHAKDLTGKVVERTLLSKIADIPSIKIYENHTAVDLLTEHQLKISSPESTCYGAYILNNETGAVHTFLSKVTFLATGGAGQVYLHTTNPDVSSGDGVAMAYRAGADIADMEFIQFHPTSLYSSKRKGRAFLISEAVRGEGGILINRNGKRIMEGVHPDRELAPRDIVARTIDSELKKSGDSYIYLDISFKGKKFLKERFPAIYSRCLEEGIDISKEPIPVVPAAHYCCGGILTDIHGKSSIKNLFVAGEAACTGVHGANRLASNSLLEGLVFAKEAYKYCKKIIDDKIKPISIPTYPLWDNEGTFDLEEWILIQHNIDDVKRVMWDYVGIVRTDLRLRRAYTRILLLSDEIHNYYSRSTTTSRIVELRNLGTVAKLIIKGALLRKESIGLHYNSDHVEPNTDVLHAVLRSQKNPLLITHNGKEEIDHNYFDEKS